MLFYNSVRNTFREGTEAKEYIDPKTKKKYTDILVHEPPQPKDEYVLIDFMIQNPDGTYGKWEQNIDKLKTKCKKHIKEEFMKKLALPLKTSFGFEVDTKEEDYNNLWNGLLQRIIDIDQTNHTLLNQEEKLNLYTKNITSSIFEKVKSENIDIRDYSNVVRTITLGQLRNISFSQLKYISLWRTKKWKIQKEIDEAQTVDEVLQKTSLWNE